MNITTKQGGRGPKLLHTLEGRRGRHDDAVATFTDCCFLFSGNGAWEAGRLEGWEAGGLVGWEADRRFSENGAGEAGRLGASEAWRLISSFTARSQYRRFF